jgi:hypothetical protein
MDEILCGCCWLRVDDPLPLGGWQDCKDDYNKNQRLHEELLPVAGLDRCVGPVAIVKETCDGCGVRGHCIGGFAG